MIVTLCGSARFEPWFHCWNQALTLSGHLVFTLGAFPSQNLGRKEWYAPEQKVVLDTVHKEKIRASRAVLFLNVFGYLGASSLSELACAHDTGKELFFLESWGFGQGVTEDHDPALVKAARRALGGAFPYPSPIDATYRTFGYAHDLLGLPGENRSAIVSYLHERQEDAIDALRAGAVR